MHAHESQHSPNILQVAMQAAAVEPKVSLKCTGSGLTQSKERGGTTHEGLSVGSWHVDSSFMGWNHAATSTLLEEAMSYIMCTPSSEFTIIFHCSCSYRIHPPHTPPPAFYSSTTSQGFGESWIVRSNGVRSKERAHLHGPVGRRDGGAWGQREC
jgi:hypothetical protein